MVICGNTQLQATGTPCWRYFQRFYASVISTLFAVPS